MLMPNDYHEVREAGNYIRLPDGGYICKIMSLTEEKTRTGRDAIYVSLDIAEGEYKGHYANEWKNDTRQEKRWGAIFIQPVYTTADNKTNPFFKAFCTAFEKSNDTLIAWTDDATKFAAQFKNKSIGCVFASEQYINNKGLPAWSVKPVQIHSVDAIRGGDFKVPEPKRLEDIEPSVSAPSMQWQPLAGDQELPF